MSDRRRNLRIAIKLLAWVGFVAVAYIFISGLFTPSRTNEELAIDLAGLAPGETKKMVWGSRTVVVLRRDAAMIEALRLTNPQLLDPDSHQSLQPDSCENPFRSMRPDLFVAIAHSPDLGCEIDFIPAMQGDTPSPWHGGFRDRCSATWYDPAGRVYGGGSGTHNLAVPPYQEAQGHLLLGN